MVPTPITPPLLAELPKHGKRERKLRWFRKKQGELLKFRFVKSQFGSSAEPSQGDCWSAKLRSPYQQCENMIDKKSLLSVRLLALAPILIVAMTGYAWIPNSRFETQSEAGWLADQPAKNIFQHHVDDPEATDREIKRAWLRFQKAQGFEPRSDGKPDGLSEEEIETLEQEMCQRLPDDLKSFLRIYRSHGDHFLDLDLYTPGGILNKWRLNSSLGITTYNGPSNGFAHHGEPGFCDQWVFPIASEHLDELGFDLRNGKMMETCDCDSGWIAGSLVELLDTISEQFENGKVVGRYYYPVEEAYDWRTIKAAGDKFRKGLLDSCMWNIYPADPTKIDLKASRKSPVP